MKSFSGKTAILADRLCMYVITNRAWLGLPANASEEQKRAALCDQVKQALAGGATFVQMREKNLDDWSMVDEADALHAICADAGIPFVVNDSVAIAIAARADGVHIGQDDMPVKDARALIGPNKILGVSVQTAEQAVLAQRQGANYLGVGAMFPTSSKDDAADVSPDELRAICDAVDIPVVAIGGITKDNIAKIGDTGICGAAVISAVFAQKNITEATATLKAAIKEALV